jgi:hypothetical protein
MISRLKRLVNSNENSTQSSAATPEQTNSNNNQQQQQQQQQTNSNLKATNILNNGMHYISESLQKKFSRGVNYNSNKYKYYF